MKNAGQFICLFLIFFFFANVQAAFYKSTVMGRIVDEYGKPVPDALISLETQEEDDSEDYRYLAKSDAAGRFSVENISESNLRQRRLFVTSPRPNLGYELIDPPFYSLRNKQNNYDGLPLKLKGKEQILDLGNVQIQVWYSIVEVYILDNSGNPFYLTLKDWQKMELVIRDARNKFVAGRGISIEGSRKFVDLANGSIKLELPVGQWYAEVIKDLSILNSVLGNSELFVVVKNGGNQKTKIILDRK